MLDTLALSILPCGDVGVGQVDFFFSPAPNLIPFLFQGLLESPLSLTELLQILSLPKSC